MATEAYKVEVRSNTGLCDAEKFLSAQVTACVELILLIDKQSYLISLIADRYPDDADAQALVKVGTEIRNVSDRMRHAFVAIAQGIAKIRASVRSVLRAG